MAIPQVDGVIDMTFLDIREENEFQTHFASKLEAYNNRSTSPSRPPNQSGSGSPDSSTKKRGAKEPVKAIRMGNNYLSSVETIHSVPELLDSSKIMWLDLSFNCISTLTDHLSLCFPQLTTLYLHANKIGKLSEIKKLSKLEHLRSLSLYGNPVEEKKHYRNYVLYNCKKLAQFDKSPVTKSQVHKVGTCSFSSQYLVVSM
jgi:hypothetical protein